MNHINRIGYIDSAKAIAIILVIIGHCHWLGCVPYLRQLIYSFHMPLFFLISGFFIKNVGLVEGLKKYSKAYLWPYLVIGILIILIGIANSLYHEENFYKLIPLNLIKIIFGSNYESSVLFGGIPRIGPSWFLLALFWGCVAMSFIQKLKTRTEQISVIVIAICFSICSAKLVKMPLSIQAGVICITYIYLGAQINRYHILNDLFSLPMFIKMIGGVLWIIAAVYIGGLDIGSGYVGYSIVGFATSLIGSFYILYICKIMDIKIAWIGRNTLNILCAHILIWRIFDIFDLSAKDLSFHPYINFMIEVFCQISLAILLGWTISKTHLLDFNKVKSSILIVKNNDYV